MKSEFEKYYCDLIRRHIESDHCRLRERAEDLLQFFDEDVTVYDVYRALNKLERRRLRIFNKAAKEFFDAVF